MSFSIAIFVSGNGGTLQAIIDAIEEGKLSVRIGCVIADRNCFAIERAKKHALPHYVLKRGADLSARIESILQKHPTDLIALAGFLSILSADFCHTWNHKIINIHPSLLPLYGGVGMWGDHVHKSVLEKGERISGATAHYVTSEVDKGEIIAQASCPIEANETVSSLREKIQKLERPLFVEAIDKIYRKATSSSPK